MESAKVGLGAKRRRENNADDDASERSSKKATPDDKRSLAAPPEIFQAVILKIRLKNFLSYDDVEIHPGPALNLIIGANGAGKSTILDAVCLVLAGKVSIVDRGKSAATFIKHGQSEGSVEITLKQPVGTLRVKRTIYAGGNGKSDWEINGKKSNENEVQEVAKKNHIKLDNMCHFLPQEKVQSFAETAKKPDEMLKVVQAAVGPDWMLQLHKDLIEESKKGSSLLQTAEAQAKELAELRNKEAQLQDEISRFEKIRHLSDEIDIIAKKIPWVKKYIAHDKMKEKKNEYEDALKVQKDAKSQYDEKKRPLDAAKAKLDAAKNENTSCVHAASKAANDIKKIQEEEYDLMLRQENKERELADIEVQQKKNEEEIARKEKELQENEKKLATAGPPPKDIEKKIKEVTEELNRISSELTKMQQERRGQRDALATKTNTLNYKERQLNTFKDVRQSRLDSLRNNSYTEPLWKVHQWLQRNRDQFRKDVYGPLQIELEVQNNEDGKYLELALGRYSDSFLVQTKEDMKTFNDLMYKDPELRGLKDRIRLLDSSQVTSADIPRLESISEFQNYGVKGYLLERIRGPEIIINTLCMIAGLHRVVIGTEALYDRANDYGQMFSEDRNGKRFHKFASQAITPKGQVQLMYSIYGMKQFTCSRSPLNRTWGKFQAGESGKKQEIEAEVRRLREELDEAKRLDAVEEEKLVEVSRRKADCEERRTAVKEEKNKVNVLQTKIKHISDRISELRKQDPRKNEPRLKRERGDIVAKRIGNLAKLTDIAEQIFEKRKQAFVHELSISSLREEVSVLERATSELKRAVEDADRVASSIRQQYENYKKAVEEAKRLCQPLTDDDKERFKHLPEQVEELEQEHMLKSSELNGLGHATDRKNELANASAKIRELEGKVGSGHNIMAEHKQRIATMKKRWLEGDGSEGGFGLNQIVKTINEAFADMFAEIGNTGQVRLREVKDGENDDFDKFGLEILVSFRENSELKQLTGQNQSGGETSFSIMLFIISLQQMTNVPFRFVDEINQGMDAHYEKFVFDKIVQYTCVEKTAQTFLISPKLQGNLLNDLQEHITVFIPCKGEYMLTHSDWPMYPSWINRQDRRKLETA